MYRLAILAALLAASTSPQLHAQTPHTRTAEESVRSGATVAGLDDLDWLVGYWEGTGLEGAPAREHWLAPVGTTMVGVFVQSDGAGEVRFTELMQITREGETLVLRIRHFDADLTAWEKKDESEVFVLLAIEEGAAYFDGLTLRREGDDGLLAAVRTGNGAGEAGELVFRYRRSWENAPPSRCPELSVTPEIEACLLQVATKSEATYRRYLDAALDRYVAEPGVQSAIRKADAAFETYREAECGALYEAWKEGTIRGVMMLDCRIAMTDARTHAIWQRWLTYPDSTPPLLPEPAPTR